MSNLVNFGIYSNTNVWAHHFLKTKTLSILVEGNNDSGIFWFAPRRLLNPENVSIRKNSNGSSNITFRESAGIIRTERVTHMDYMPTLEDFHPEHEVKMVVVEDSMLRKKNHRQHNLGFVTKSINEIDLDEDYVNVSSTYFMIASNDYPTILKALEDYSYIHDLIQKQPFQLAAHLGLKSVSAETPVVINLFTNGTRPWHFSLQNNGTVVELRFKDGKVYREELHELFHNEYLKGLFKPVDDLMMVSSGEYYRIDMETELFDGLIQVIVFESGYSLNFDIYSNELVADAVERLGVKNYCEISYDFNPEGYHSGAFNLNAQTFKSKFTQLLKEYKHNAIYLDGEFKALFRDYGCYNVDYSMQCLIQYMASRYPDYFESKFPF